MMKNLRKYCNFKAWLIILPLLALFSASLPMFNAVPEITPAPHAAFLFHTNHASQPPLAPSTEDHSDSGVLRGLLPGNLPPALLLRRNSERQNPRLFQDSNAAFFRPQELPCPLAYLSAETDFPTFEFHSILRKTLPPRAGPSII